MLQIKELVVNKIHNNIFTQKREEKTWKKNASKKPHVIKTFRSLSKNFHTYFSRSLSKA